MKMILVLIYIKWRENRILLQLSRNECHIDKSVSRST